MNQFVKAAEAAAMCGFASPATFLRHRARLEADHNFPMPMPVHTQPMLWRREEVAAWVALQGLPRQIDPAAMIAPGGNVVLMAEARQA